jgi:hypothetical protein
MDFLQSIESMFNPGKGYHKANKQLGHSWEEAKSYQIPYQQAGLSQLPILQGAQSELLNPSALLNKWMQSYETSPYAKKSMENARSSGMDTASSMGLLGSSTALNNIQNSSSDIMNKDRDQFLKDLMQKYLSGIGIGQNIYGTGATTAGNLGKGALGIGEEMAKGAYGEQNAGGNMLMSLLPMIASFLL